jgi:isopentenyldiphosphate isomerase/intracellular septation protein A
MKLNNIRSMAPGILPLVVLIVAEMIWGITTGLLVALAMGVIELAYYAIKHKRFEKSVLADIGIIVLFGLAALFLEGETLNQLKPVFIMMLLLMVTGVSAFSKYNLLMATAGRYLKNMRIGPWEMHQMRQTMMFLFWMLAFYTMVLVGAIFFLSTDVVEFMGGNGLFILFGCFMALEFVRKRLLTKKHKDAEWLPLVDDEGLVIGQGPRPLVHNSQTRWLHPVVHLQLIKDKGLWLQKRPMHKLVQPGKWDTAVGGHLSAGEPVALSLQREAMEEIGVDVIKPLLLGRYIWESDIEREMVFAFAMVHNGKVNPHPEELDGGRVWLFDEIEESLGKGVFTSNFEHEYELYKDLLLKLVE